MTAQYLEILHAALPIDDRFQDNAALNANSSSQLRIARLHLMDKVGMLHFSTLLDARDMHLSPSG